ncbi:MAG: GAF domain-containing protein [Anaerolineae bacterium]|nr:GAF domain-containing protein [Anaerolineae bacterium]
MRVIRKLLTPTLIFVGLIIAGLIAFNTTTTVRQFDIDEETRLNNMNAVFNTRLNELGNLAVALASEVSNNPEVQAAFAAKDRERLTELTLASYQSVDAQFDIPQHQFHLAPATSFLRLHNLEKFDDDLSSFRFTVLAANAQKVAVSGPEIGRGGLGVRGVVPVNYQGEHVGTVEFGTNVDRALLETMKEGFGFEWQILLSRAPAEVAIFEGATEAESQGPIDELLLQASTLSFPLYSSTERYEETLAGTSGVYHLDIEDAEYGILSAPLYDFSGNVIGVIDIISDHTIITTQQNNQVLISLGILLSSLLLVGFGFSFIANRTLRPIGDLSTTASAVAEGDFSQRAEVTSDDEIGALAQIFNGMTEQLQGLFGTLEERVANATQNLTLAAEVGRSVSQARDVDTLLKNAVELIQDRFDMYYTQAYLLDTAGRQLILRAGTGAVGQQLLNRRHSLPMDLSSLNGTAAVERRAVIVEDTETSLIHRPNPLLPETRSEVVVPLLVGDRVVGVLDMQSRKADVLSHETLPAFEALAGQIAVAIQNVELLSETEAARAEIEAQAGRLIHSGWSEFLNAFERGERIGYSYDLEEVTPFTEDVPSNLDQKNLVSTIQVSNEPIGILQFEGLENWTSDDTELVDTIAQQLGQQVENLRLLAQADQYRVEAESALRRITREGWQDHFDARQTTQTGFSYDLNTVTLTPEDVNGYAGTETPLATYIMEILGEKIGELSVADTGSIDEGAKEMLATIGEQLSARIENLRLFEETERGQIELNKRARQLASVAEISTAASMEPDVEKMLANVVHLTQRQFGLYHAHVFTYNEISEELEIVACGYKEGEEQEGTHGTTTIPLAQEQSLVARAARSGQAIIINDVQNEPGWLPNPELPDTRAELAVPLLVGDELLGVLDVQAEHINAFSQEDANIQLTLASQVATAMQNARSYTQAQKQADREATLNIISQKIQSATSVEAVLQIAARELGHALDAPMTIAQLSLKDKE